MTKQLEVAAFYLIAAVIFWPWSVAALDLGTWMLLGSQATPIPWISLKGILLVFWPVLALLAINALADLIPDGGTNG